MHKIRDVNNTWATGKAESLYLITHFGLELASQYTQEAENCKNAGIKSKKYQTLLDQITLIEILEVQLREMKPGSFVDGKYSPHVEGLANLFKG